MPLAGLVFNGKRNPFLNFRCQFPSTQNVVGDMDALT